MSDQPDTSEPKAPQRQFEAKLFQVARVHTETFKIEATNESEAKKAADAIADAKDIKEAYDFEIVDVTPKPEPAPEAEEAPSEDQ